ncbi:MAG TPA: MmcQ/YjbR family DNA-binding protein [Phnomibacter sp.]|nr:MmcQ/YjbR family DNA-binding protein [Phnomibacter sp.]
MVTFEMFRNLALSLPETRELPHLEKISYRIGTRIFATYNPPNNQACLKLSAREQDALVAAYPHYIYPVNNTWGKQGWTLFEIDQVSTTLFSQALKQAYCQVAPKKLAASILQNTHL